MLPPEFTANSFAVDLGSLDGGGFGLVCICLFGQIPQKNLGGAAAFLFIKSKAAH